MKKDKILVTPSDNIPFSEIEKHLGVVDSQIVVGANLFRDVFAGFRDIFGGETKGYKKDIDKMKTAALASIKEQAKERGANAIVSVRIDLDEYSGSGKSMFMLNIYGSAIKLKDIAIENNINNGEISEFSIDDIKYYKNRNQFLERINQSIFNADMSELDDNIYTERNTRNISLDDISKYKLWSSEVTQNVLLYINELSASNLKRKELNNNLSEIPLRYIEKFLAENINRIDSNLWKNIYQNFDSSNWLNYKLLKKLLSDDNHVVRFRALKLCSIKKDFYEVNEVEALREIGDFIINEFDNSFESKTISKTFGKKEVFKCPNCFQMRDIETQVHSCAKCETNKFGIKPRHITDKDIGNDLIETADALKVASEAIG